METSASPPLEPEKKAVIGYPSMGRYNQAQYPEMHPGYPVPMQPVAYPPSIHSQGNYPIYTPNQPSDPFNPSYHPNPYLPMIPEPKTRTTFGQMMLILMILFVAVLCAMSLIMWFLFGTYIPSFQVMSLNLSNFTATNTTFTGKWDANVSITNLNEDLEIHFGKLRSSIFYRESMMGISSVQPFELPKRQATNLTLSVPAEHITTGTGNLQTLMLPSLEQDQRNGIVVFSLRLAFHVNFTSSNIVYREDVLKVFCENLKVNISSSGEGNLAPELENDCLIRIAHD